MRVAGDQLAHFRLDRRIDAHHEVWRATDTRDDRAVAVKLLPHLSDPARLERLRRDAEALAGANHPTIVQVGEIGEAGGVHFVSTDPLDGTGLLDWVPRGGLATGDLLENAEVLADAVRTAHEAGVTHRELGPDRVYALPDGGLRIHDFGLSSTVEGGDDPDVDPDDTPTLTLTREGERRNLAYRSPEQIKNHPLDRSTDLYSVGCLLYWMSTGVHPFRGDSPADLCVGVLRDVPRPITELKHDVPDGLAPIVARCLAKERGERYPSAADLAEALGQLA